jgi:hypothetical protein
VLDQAAGVGQALSPADRIAPRQARHRVGAGGDIPRRLGLRPARDRRVPPP